MRKIAVPLCLMVLGLLAAALPASGKGARQGTLAREPFTGIGLEDLDARPGRVLPSAAQVAAVRRLGATVRWNRFGTPASLINRMGDLGPARGNPVEGARAWVARHRKLFRLSTAGVSNLRLLADSVTAGNAGHAVVLQQRFGGLAAGYSGLITLGVARGRVYYVSSSAAGDGVAPARPTMTAVRAWLHAARAVGERVTPADVVGAAPWKGWTRVRVRGYALPQVARLTALPLPDGRVRSAFLTVVFRSGDGEAAGYTQLVDARTGRVWVRDNFVDQLAQVPVPYPPTWRYFPASPPLDYSTNDTRILGCWEWDEDCDFVFPRLASRAPWDFNTRLNLPTFTTSGNNAVTAQAWLSPFTPAEQYRPVSPTRQYDFGWTNQWYTSRCDPASLLSPQRADIDASVAHLFASHNRMHDWSYLLGFTERNFNLQDDNFGNRPAGLAVLGGEGDPEVGDAQAGALTGGFPSYLGRDNANQITPPDGLAPVTNQYLFQPIAGAFYAPCVDGSYDMTVVGHEYTHAISNRMVAGPLLGLVGLQPGAMGESWSDLVAMEYLNEYGYLPVEDENPWAVGPYATGNKEEGIRNYALNRNPLNYSDLSYDQVGAQVHADGEIWSGTNFELRRALVRKWNARYPAHDRVLQRRCADGEIVVHECPGNRRWMQIVFDAFLLMQSDVTMVDARDAYLAADMMRFKGANQAELWEVFARRGLGASARSAGSEDVQPTPSFHSPLASDQARVRFRAVAADGKGGAVRARVFVGDFQARVTPVADTDRATDLTDTVRFVPGRYRLVVQAPGHGAHRFEVVLGPGRHTVTASLPTNWASVGSGAEASGDGPVQRLIDDTERTVWFVEGGAVRGRQVTVDLGRRAHMVRVVAVSALRAPNVGGLNTPVPVPEPVPVPVAGNRFSALRQFAVLACDSTKKDCSKDGNFRRIYTSPPDAFPAGLPRPLAPDLTLRTFDVPDTRATHVRIVVLHNQCTGQSLYHGELDNDPLNPTDCVSGSVQDTIVQASEFQVFSGRPALR